MTINRRNAIRQLTFLAAGAAPLPSCMGGHEKPDLVLNNFTVDDARRQTLDLLTATLIPTTDTPGARETGASFAEATAPQRDAILTSIGDKKIPGDELNFFYSTTRRLTILAYSSSPYYLTKVQVYELVPGRWHGCVPVTTSRKSVS